MKIDLAGKIAIVTGVGRGIGRAIAETLMAEGVTVVGIDIDEEALKDLAQMIGHSTSTPFEGGASAGRWNGEALKCDVRDREAVHELVSRTVERYGRIDILVNNAGVAAPGKIETMSEAAWDANLDTNLKGTFLMCQAVAPVMKAQKSGRIINAASFAAIVPSVGSAAYAASKAGVVSFTRVLAGELGPWNVTVNCYSPGMIPTQMNHFAEAPPRQQQRLLDTLTLRRWGEKQDVARLICFLASDLAGYITGSMIDISGGKIATQIPRVAYEWAAESGDYSFE